MNSIEEFEIKNDCFGTVTWDMGDLSGALEEQEVPATKENLEALYDALIEEIDDFKEAMIQAGRSYIYDVINDMAYYGDLKSN